MRYRYLKRKQAGLSMIDVMLAIFIFSIGLLGIAGLQMFAKKANYEAVQRTTAVMLVNDIIERMRSNADQATGRDSTNTAIKAYLTIDAGVTKSGFEPVADVTEVTPTCLGSANPCDTVQRVARDLWEWQQAILGATDIGEDGVTPMGGLVEPSACIDDPTPADPNNHDIRVAIAWRSQTPSANPTSSACGAGTGKYGANNEFRQVFVVTAVINPDS